MNSVADFLKRTAERNGYSRDRFEEKNVPTDYSNITVFPFFGDIRSSCIASSFILNRYRAESKSSKYFIVASWPGLQGLFPYADEYWSLNDTAHLKTFYERSQGFSNKSDIYTVNLRNFNEFFRDVVDYKDISVYHENGFTNKFFENYKDTKRFLPFIPSSAMLGRDFNKDLATFPGYKIFIHPSLFSKQWSEGSSKNVHTSKNFWIDLVKKLLEAGYTPVIWQNFLSHDISQDFIGKCVFISENDITRVLSAMRSTGFVLDIFNSISRLSLIARCPFLCVDERARYFTQKDYELDDLYPELKKDYIFTFSTIMTNGTPNGWNQDIFKSILVKLENILPELNRDDLPSTKESTDLVSYNKQVRKNKSKRMGIRFFKLPKD